MSGMMFKLCVVILAFIARDCSSQEDEDGPYRGKFIGKINSYHHQVSGDVYAVDEWTLLLVDFNYDGTGDDTFFWAGDSGRPGPQGFIVPDQHGKTNILEKYYNEDVRLTLPEGKRISRIKWLSVYDINSQNAFGDVYIPDEFEAPAPLTIGPLTGPAVSSQPIQLLDAATILIPELRYDGSGEEVYFWTGVGPQPSAKGHKIPDEYGYLEPLGAYGGAAARLRLPGALSLLRLNWIALLDVATGQVLGSALLPEAANVPPALRPLHPYAATLPHCRQLHRDYQVAWEVFGNQITFQLAGLIEEDEYMAFGISGSPTESKMVGADVAVARYVTKLQRGLATDYNLTDAAPCVMSLGAWRGACRDDRLGGQDSNQVLAASRHAGLTVVTYRRQLQPSEAMDKEWAVGRPVSAVWATGRVDAEGEPSYHAAFPRRPLALSLAADPPYNDCFAFSLGERAGVGAGAWETAQLFDPALRVFRLALGPAGGRRGRAARGGAPPPLVWYVNGQLAPDLQLRRGLTYEFQVRGGNDPHSAALYHPLVVTAEPHGGLERLPEAAQRARRVLAGLAYTRRGRLAATAAGPLCVARRPPGADPRRDASFPSFRAFNRSLAWSCPPARPATLSVAPNSSWPDLVYYHSFTHPDMGGRIFIVDRHRRNIARSAAPPRPPLAPRALLALALAAVTSLAARRSSR